MPSRSATHEWTVRNMAEALTTGMAALGGVPPCLAWLRNNLLGDAEWDGAVHQAHDDAMLAVSVLSKLITSCRRLALIVDPSPPLP